MSSMILFVKKHYKNLTMGAIKNKKMVFPKMKLFFYENHFFFREKFYMNSKTSKLLVEVPNNKVDQYQRYLVLVSA